MIEDFLPSEHWREFEHFALRVVEIKVQESIVYDEMVAWRTSDTNDQGVDGQILLAAAKGDLHITVEAKLRKGGGLSLKDFASSIVNYLVESSDIHFIVTNVRFTKDAYRILDVVNSDSRFSLNYLDCHALCDYADKHSELERLFPALMENIRIEAAKNTPLPRKSRVEERRQLVVTFLPVSRKKALSDLLTAICSQTPLIVLSGPRGTDKSLLMDLCMRRLCNEKPLIRIDMQYLGSLRVFLLAFLKNLLGLDVFECLNLLSDQMSDDVWQDGDPEDTHRSRIVGALRKLLQVRHEDNDPQAENYLMRELLREFTGSNHKHRVLLLENLNTVTPETLLEVMSLLPQIAGCNISIILELSLHIPMGNQTLVYPEWYRQISQIQSMRIAGKSTVSITLEEYSTPEAADMLSSVTGQAADSYFVRQLLRKYGKNPAILREAAADIKKRNITTSAELQSIAVPGSEEDILRVLLAVLQEAGERGVACFQAIRWCLQTADLLYGYVSHAMVAAIDAYCLTAGSTQVLTATGLLQKLNDGFLIRNEAAGMVLHNTVAYWDVGALLEFLLENRKQWGLPELTQECAEANMLFNLHDRRFLEAADAAVHICEQNREAHLVAGLLSKCRDYTRPAVTPEKRLRHLSYALRTLEKEHELELTDMEEREAAGNALLEQCTALYLACASPEAATLLIQCALLQNGLRRSRFHFAEGEEFINMCFSLVNMYGLDDLGSRAYVAKALCVKEQGSLDRCFDVFRQGIRRYPHDPYLRSCYLANYAADLGKRNLPGAVRVCVAALAAARQTGDSELFCWLQEDLIMYQLESGENDLGLLLDIQACRQNADMHGYRPDISRTYNLEGVYAAIGNHFEHAAHCFRNASQCYAAVTDQQKFLFRCNMLSVLPIKNAESTEVFQQQMLWLSENRQWLFDKLNRRPDLSSETNFAALVSLLATALRQKNTEAFSLILTWFPLLPLTVLHYKEQISPKALLSPRFLLSPKNILILF